MADTPGENTCTVNTHPKNPHTMTPKLGGSLRIYIAGPYSAKTRIGRLSNVRRAVDAALELFNKGHFPYVPHLTHYVDVRVKQIGRALSWADYIRWDMPWLEVSDAILYLGSSKGADLELDAARARGKLVFFSVEDIPWSKNAKPKHPQHHLVRARAKTLRP